LITIIVAAVFGIFQLQDHAATWQGMSLYQIYLNIIVVCSVFIILSGHYHFRMSGITNATKKDILKEMKLIEDKYEKTQSNDPQSN